MKKLTKYVVAAMAMCAVGASFTGCIDTDEPAGIEQLRNAKASLLKSKEALVAAQAQRELAEAEAIKVKAAAEALYYEALAAKTDAERAKIQAEMQAAVLAAEQALAAAKLEYERALVAWEQEKLELSQNQVNSLNVWYTAYFDALDTYNQKYLDYIEAQANYVKGALDSNGTAFDTKKRLEKSIASAREDLANAQSELTALNDTLALAKTWTPSELGVKWASYNEELTAAQKKQGELAVQLKERESQSTEGKAYTAAKDALADVKARKVTIPAYTFTPSDQVSIPGITEARVIIAKDMTYTWNAQSNYLIANNLLTNWVSEIKSYILDDNDREWTKARINELKNEAAGISANVDEQSAAWKMFVTAYNLGAATDYTALAGYTELNAAVAAYNAAVPATQKAKKAYIDAFDAAEKANEATGISTEPQEHFAAAVDAANEAYENAIKTATAAKDAAVAKLQNEKDAAESALVTAIKKSLTAAGLAEKYPDDETLAAAATAAAKAVESAQATYDAAAQALADGLEAEDAKLDRATDIASAARENAINDAESTLAREQKAANDAAAKADAAALAAQKAMNDAYLAYEDAFGNLNSMLLGNDVKGNVYESVLAQIDAIAKISPNVNDNAGLSNLIAFALTLNDAQYDRDLTLPSCEVADVCAYSTADLKQNIINASRTLYGYYSDETLDDNKYPGLNIPAAQIVPLTKADVDAILAQYGIAEIDYPNYYGSFGTFGSLIYVDNRIEVATAYLNNKDMVDQAVAGAQTELDNLLAAYDALEADVNAAHDAVDAAEEAFMESNKDLQKQITDNGRQITVLQDLIRLIETYKPAASSPDYAIWSQDTLDKFIKGLEDQIKKQEKTVADKTTALEKAEYLLDQYQKGLVSTDEINKIEVERARLAMELAKQKCDAAKAQLDAAIKRFEESAA